MVRTPPKKDVIDNSPKTAKKTQVKRCLILTEGSAERFEKCVPPSQ